MIVKMFGLHQFIEPIKKESKTGICSKQFDSDKIEYCKNKSAANLFNQSQASLGEP